MPDTALALQSGAAIADGAAMVAAARPPSRLAAQAPAICRLAAIPRNFIFFVSFIAFVADSPVPENQGTHGKHVQTLPRNEETNLTQALHDRGVICTAISVEFDKRATRNFEISQNQLAIFN
ncbi:hypothetical protein [Mycobacterium sp. 1164985.4]|uniref:hypothetical protein n=1 Tax=Mycobacterium sp. 1164985.4 TaxID=1834069 RepID=UPI001E64C6C6|nr:hypothetical protein [Mycobacterium sp. 1164985.4]